MPDDDDSSMIFFPGDQEDFDDHPQEFKDHMAKAFEHKAGLGPHPGKYQGPPLKMREGDEQDDRDITDADRQRAQEEPLEDEHRPHEAGYKKMKAAQTGGSLAPSEMEQTAAKQQGTMEQQAATQGAIQASKAQGAQAPIAPPPPAPGGPVGVTQPYPAEAKETPPGIPEAPGAPGGRQ